MKRFALFLCAVFFVALFVACSTDAGDEPEAPAPAATPAPATYTVTFNANGGAGSMQSQTFTRGVEQALRANTFTRTGYAFAGWAKTANAEAKEWSDKESISIEENITLYAVWMAGGANYTVLHYKQNTALNDYDEPVKEIFAGKTNAKTEAKAREYEGFTAKSFEQATIAADGSTVVNIYYDRNAYTVTFNANGGAGSMQTQTFTYGVAQALTANAFTRAGYTFAGWATTADGSKAYDDKASYTIGAENVTLYAVWKPATYTVTFNANGGGGSMQSQTFTYGVAQALTANAFTRAGYTFAGWATTANGTKAYDDKASYTIGAENVTLYAVWNKMVSHDVSLKTLSFNGTAVKVYDSATSRKETTVIKTAGTHEYYIEYRGKELTITAEKNDEKATLTLSSASVTAADSTEKDVTLTVIAEDGVTKNTYTLHTVRVFTFDEAVTAIQNRTTNVTIKMVGTVQNSSLERSYSNSSYTDSALSTALKSASSKVSLDMSAVTELTSIEYSAFYECKSLTSVVIPNSVKTINYQAFDGCTSLTSATIPDSVTSIGNYAFFGCKLLTSVVIPDSVTSIGDHAFDGCTLFTSVNIPDKVKSIGKGAFSGCKLLTSVTIGNSLTTINYKAFYGCTSLTSLTIPDSVTRIEGYAFSGCTSLTSVDIPNSVTSIWDYAFSYCTSLTSLTIPDSVTSIGGFAFQGCTSLTSVTIGKSVTSIGVCAFFNCKLLTSVNIPDSVTSIGVNAFYNCTSLTSVVIPNSVEKIGFGAFSGCTLLTSVTFSVTGEWYYTGNVNYTGGEKLSVTDLENVNTAAVYLRETYADEYWYRE